MSDPNNPNIKIRSTPQYALMQREQFWDPNIGVFPPFDTGQYESFLCVRGLSLTLIKEPDNVKALAKERLTESGWYVTSADA